MAILAYLALWATRQLPGLVNGWLDRQDKSFSYLNKRQDDHEKSVASRHESLVKAMHEELSQERASCDRKFDKMLQLIELRQNQIQKDRIKP